MTTKHTQSMAADQTGPYGQIIKSSDYSYGDLVNPARTYRYTWDKLVGLLSFWRQSLADVVDGTNSNRYTISSSWLDTSYSGSYPFDPLTAAPHGVTFHDSTLFAGLPTSENMTPRGLVMRRWSGVGDVRASSTVYDTTGIPLRIYTDYAPFIQYTYGLPDYGDRHMLPASLLPNGGSDLSSSFTWATFLGLTQEIGPNGATTSISYDGAARPWQTTSPDGAVTNYGYTNATANASATVVTVVNSGGPNSRWTISTLDGLGRTIQTDSGTAATQSTADSLSRVLSVYGPCACSPMGKLMRVSRPFNPSTETPVYTVYSYDPLGRTTSVTLPDGVSTTTYAYSGNTVTVTDPAGHWKKYTSDAFGNVTQVNEPNPAGAGNPDYVTNYTYNLLGKLTSVTMPRTMPGGNVVTQTRSFTYDSSLHLISETHPESGTTTYTYDSAGRVLTKTDAKSNRVTYTYDLYGRVTTIARAPLSGNGTVEPEPLTTFTYDTADSLTGLPYPMQTFAPLNTWGRLAKIQHGALSVERFQYNVAGRITAKSLATVNSGVEQLPFIRMFTWDTEGRLTGFTPDPIIYPTNANNPPDTPVALNLGGRTWTYDAMGRPSSLILTDSRETAVPLATNATYNAAGQLLSYQFPAVMGYVWSPPGDPGLLPDELATLQFTYNSLGQLTRQSGGYPVAPDIQYNYPVSGNDGRIQSRVDDYPTPNPPAQGGPATISYAYDSLGRLTSASSASSVSSEAWGQSFVYDPFGNLLQQNVTGGNAPALNISVDPATNRMSIWSVTYDAAGNLTKSPDGTAYAYDSENRLSQLTPTSDSAQNYYYGANGERLYDGKYWHFYGPGGIEVTSLAATQSRSGHNLWSLVLDTSYIGTYGYAAERLRFAGRLVWQGGAAAVTDRLGSVVGAGVFYPPAAFGYYPYGAGLTIPQPLTSPPFCYYLSPGCNVYPGTRDVAFGTYHRGSYGLDYAMNRYYDPARGRFTSPDPAASGETSRPNSWNRYAYTEGDPVNHIDRTGLYLSAEQCIDDPQACEDEDWGIYYGFIGGAGGGGGARGTRNDWLVELRNKMDALAAAKAIFNIGRSGSAPVSMYLQVKSECWAKNAPTAGIMTYNLQVTYQIESSTQAAMKGGALTGLSISESLAGATGSLVDQAANPATWTSSPSGLLPNGSASGIRLDGTFTDYLSGGGTPLFPGSGSAFQMFTAKWGAQNQPLMILGFGDTTVLNNVYGQNNVMVNGHGLGTDPAKMCH